MNQTLLKDLKSYMASQPKIKVYLWISFVIISPTFLLWFIWYAFQFHGMMGIYNWVDIAKALVVCFICFALSIPFLSLLDFFLAQKKHSSDKQTPIKVPSRAMWAIFLIALITPLSLLVWVKGSYYYRKGDSSPQLLLSDTNGKYNIPDVAITFWTEKATQNFIEWGIGETPENGFRIEENVSQHSHVFMLKDLVPNTTYWYRVNGGDVRVFTTPAAIENTLHFAVASDPHVGAITASQEDTIKILQQINNRSRGYDYFFFLGDTVENGFDDSQWKKALSLFYEYGGNVSIRPLIGNHDAMFQGADYYKEYFYPDGMERESPSPFYNRIDINNIHFITLDLEWGTEYYFGEQEEWFISQLESIPKEDWVIVMSHTFYYASGSYSAGSQWYDNPETIKTLVPLFEKYDVDLVFSGHIHDMEVLRASNITYTIIGSFGGKLDPKPTYWSNYSLYQNYEDFGYADVKIENDIATITLFNSVGEILFNVTCPR